MINYAKDIKLTALHFFHIFSLEWSRIKKEKKAIVYKSNIFSKVSLTFWLSINFRNFLLSTTVLFSNSQYIEYKEEEYFKR